MKKIPVIFISLLIGTSSLWALQSRMFVKVDRAVVYAEPNENSYKIDTVRRGMVLTVFDKGMDKSDWLYVTFESQRWKGKVTGFIKADLVITEEEMLREDQRRMEEEEAQKRKAEEVMREGEKESEEAAKKKTDAEMKAKAEEKTKPQDELPDLKATFAKKEPEKEEKIEKPQPAPVKEEVTEEPEVTPMKEESLPELKEEEPAPELKEEVKTTEADAKPEAVLTEKVEEKEPEPVEITPEAKPEVKPEVKEREPVQLEQKKEIEIPEPAPEEQKPEEIKPEEPEEKEILEETPQAQEVATPDARIVEAEEFKKPEPPSPAVTMTVGITESPQGRSLALYHAGVLAEGLPFAVIRRELQPPPTQLKAEEKVVEEAPAALQADVMPVKEEEPPPPSVTVVDSVTDSPLSRSISLAPRQELKEMMVYKFEVIESPEPETPEVREVRPEETKEPEKEEAPPPPVKIEEKKVPDEEERKEAGKEEDKKEEEEAVSEAPHQVDTPPEQVVKPPEQVVKPPEQIVQPTEVPQIEQPAKVGLLSFGFGYGPSWGGFGGAFQLNVTQNISIHVGGGMYPTKTHYSEFDWVTNEWLYSAGIKYYLPFGSEAIRPYVDVMYGGISVEAVQIVKEIWHYEYTYENIQKVLYGPSFMAGADLKLGFLGLTGYLGLSYNTTAWDYWDRDYFLNGGLGISLFF